MKFDLSNKVIARLSNSESQSPNRSLDLGNIITPELSLLSPNRNEIAPRGGGRDSALIAYSERLRSSYKQNEGGLRDGMVLLGEAFRNGQPISITCFCRAGQTCHADVVKLAIEKVAKAIDARELNHAARSPIAQDAGFRPSNPRTERAINEILSVSKSDLLLSKLDDTNGRNRSEHASFLNRKSQFLRDTYERGGTVQNGILIIPKEAHELKSPLKLATLGYGVGRLEAIVGSEKAREIAPKILEYGRTIAGSSADRETEAKVFRWIYDALDGKQELLDQVREEGRSESVLERFDRTLAEITKVADEMERLEPSDRSIQYEQFVESNSQTTRHSLGEELEEIAESAEYLSTERDPERGQTTLGFERIKLESTHLTLLGSEMSADELKHWSQVKFPALDEALENGIPPSTILKLFRAKSDKAIENVVKGKELNYEDLRFASAYLEHQLKQPETRLRYFNERYRDYAQILDRCQSREEVIEASSKIRIDNASAGLNRQQNVQNHGFRVPAALTSNEMQMLFTEQSPRHFTSEMIVAKLNYAGDSAATKERTEALKRGEITLSPEAQQLVDSLESRMERKYLDESLSATKHFLQSLKTPNEELRFKNSFDHSELYRKLPPAERDFVYQRATEQKNRLEATTTHKLSAKPGAPDEIAVEELRNVVKAELLALSISNADPKFVKDRASVILEKYVGDRGNNSVSLETGQLSQDLSEILPGRSTRKLQHGRTHAAAKTLQDFDQNGGRRNILVEQTR